MACCIAVPGAFAQVPDVLVKIDLRLVASGGPGRDAVFRSYDLKGMHSTVGLNFTLEPGYQAVLTQRLQRTEHDADQDQLDESYIEDPGYWRAGKQYIPFGLGRLLLESTTAGRINLLVGGDQVPATFAACQGPKGMPKGLTGRIGGKLGLSFAFGDNFGVSGTSLANLRGAENSPGKARGWSRVVGADFTTRRKSWTSSLEVASFTKGATAADEDELVSDLLFTLTPSPRGSLTFGWCRSWEHSESIFRIEGKQMLTTSLWLEPMLRVKDGKVWDLAVSLHVKL